MYVYPCRPHFYYIKMGFTGVKIIGVFSWRRGASNEYPQHTFSWRNIKNIKSGIPSYLDIWLVLTSKMGPDVVQAASLRNSRHFRVQTNVEFPIYFIHFWKIFYKPFFLFFKIKWSILGARLVALPLKSSNKERNVFYSICIFLTLPGNQVTWRQQRNGMICCCL